MSAFDTVIGYEDIKGELIRIVDILKNRDVYKSLGISIPHGLLLVGEPGVGKTLMAQALIAESGLPAVTCRKNAPDGEFVKVINQTFEAAVACAPSIVFLDDMDKFASGKSRQNSQEFATVQSCIDDVRDKNVFVLAAANEDDDFPDSLIRHGRFDRFIDVEPPSGEDAQLIIAHYLDGKNLADDIDIAALTGLLKGNSCATLETVINEAAREAAFEREEKVSMRHMVNACLCIVHDFTPSYGCQTIRESAFTGYTRFSAAIWHEAGHVVVGETLMPESVTLATVQRMDSDWSGVVTHQPATSHDRHDPAMGQIVTALGGRAAIQHRFSKTDIGASSDLKDAVRLAGYMHTRLGMGGLHLIEDRQMPSDQRKQMVEQAIANTLQQAQQKALEIVAANHEFLERVAHALAVNDYLLGRDIQAIKGECAIVNVTL